jgi:hypothetical protein
LFREEMYRKKLITMTIATIVKYSDQKTDEVKTALPFSPLMKSEIEPINLTKIIEIQFSDLVITLFSQDLTTYLNKSIKEIE